MSSGRIFVEVGLGHERVRGYGEKFPLKPGDFYVDVDLRRPVGWQGVPLKEAQPAEQIVLCQTALAKAIQEQPDMEPVLRERLQAGEALYAYAQERGAQFLPMYGGPEYLPLRSDSVDQVLLSNVIGDRMMADEAKTQLLQEARRVVAAGGLVAARETFTPDVASIYFYRHREEWNVEPIWQQAYDGQTLAVDDLYGATQEAQYVYTVASAS